MVRPRQRLGRADGRPEAGYGTVSRKHQMIAIVDREAKLRIVIGTAAPSRLRCSIGNRYLQPRLYQSYCGRKPGKACSSNCRSRKAQRVTSNLATVQSSAGLLTRTRGRGGAQPILSIRLSSFE